VRGNGRSNKAYPYGFGAKHFFGMVSILRAEALHVKWLKAPCLSSLTTTQLPSQSSHSIKALVMPTASAFSLNVKDYGVTTVIPDDDIARLMYYLNCVTIGVGLDLLQDDLVRYKDYNSLSPARIAVVFKTAVELSPDVFIGKILFRDDEGEITGNSPNSFVSISAACDIVSLQSDIIIAGKVQNVTKVMFFKSSWLKRFYVDPLQRIARAILGTRHCSHCDGEDLCTCTSACTRPSESKCQPLLGALLDALMSPSSPSPTPISRRPTPQPEDNKHQSNCDGCGWKLFTGIRYKCAVCDDYDLCSPCYNRNAHDLTHPFKQISKPGGQAIYLSPRHKVPAFTSNTSSPTNTKPATRSPPPRKAPTTFHSPPPYAESMDSSSPFFYNSMSVTELRTFLSERGVDFGDVLDKETLCRRAWDAYCDCMTMVELNTFLSDRKISTFGCRDINSRRQKAKDAFEPPTRPSRPPASSDTSAIRFRKDDTVVLTGLNRGGMNGKTATVISVDRAEGKALVRVESLGQTFKIKLENLKMEDDLEAVEELE
jgi:hypothetical protein